MTSGYAKVDWNITVPYQEGIDYSQIRKELAQIKDSQGKQSFFLYWDRVDESLIRIDFIRSEFRGEDPLQYDILKPLDQLNNLFAQYQLYLEGMIDVDRGFDFPPFVMKLNEEKGPRERELADELGDIGR